MAIQSIYRDLEYAKSLIKCKVGKNDGADADDDDDVIEESWTFVGGDEPDPEAVTKKLSEGLGKFAFGSDKALGSQVLRGGG